MHFKAFNCDIEMSSTIKPLPDSDHKYFDSLLTEAAEDRSNLGEHQVFGVVANLRKKNGTRIRVIAIGEQALYEEKQVAVGTTLALRYPNGKAFFFLRAWHSILTIPGNPIELHAKWSPDKGEHKAILNVQDVKKNRQLEAVPELLKMFNDLKQGGGRPAESTAYPRDEAIKRVKETERLFAAGKYTREMAAAIAFNESNEKNAYKMYIRYKKKYL